ncbi:MAG: hypothetical protein K0S41_2479 [Anaerocolumna sp.]|jgi:hypothetical protein|nr:hypothetical protein [Anaerocolumna sp.]
MKEKIVRLFWKYIDSANFEGLSEIMLDETCVWLPNTKEVFRGKNKYIEFNKQYPGRWYANVEKLFIADDTVITTTYIFNLDQSITFYVTSFFIIKEEKIEEITEYWSENSAPPTWRLEADLSEKYE